MAQNKIQISQRLCGEIISDYHDLLYITSKDKAQMRRRKKLEKLLKESRHNHNDRIIKE